MCQSRVVPLMASHACNGDSYSNYTDEPLFALLLKHVTRNALGQLGCVFVFMCLRLVQCRCKMLLYEPFWRSSVLLLLPHSLRKKTKSV